MSYVDYDYYVNTYSGSVITVEASEKSFLEASNAVDSLTYCRIVSRGFDNLTDFQKGIVQYVVCKLAEWQYENSDIISSPYSSYSINGVSVNITTGANLRLINGILIPIAIYSELVKTGLCYAGVR